MCFMDEHPRAKQRGLEPIMEWPQVARYWNAIRPTGEPPVSAQYAESIARNALEAIHRKLSKDKFILNYLDSL
jgi:hypothetical protein